jgi:hypothetical protein
MHGISLGKECEWGCGPAVAGSRCTLSQSPVDGAQTCQHGDPRRENRAGRLKAGDGGSPSAEPVQMRPRG